MELSESAFSTKQLGHLGLIADKIDALNLVDLIDLRLPVSEAHGAKVTHGERVAAMLLNGLGFIDNRLYLFPDFLKSKPMDKLFKRQLESSWFNDDALGRCLDAISAYGSTKLFTELSLTIGQSRGLLGKEFHLDTTTLNVYGDYDKPSYKGTKPEQGYSKNGQHRFKQMILLLATTGASNFPIWMEAHSGNISDKTSLPDAAKRLKALCKDLADSDDFVYVADSAIYSKIVETEGIDWITRVPESLKQAKDWVKRPDAEISWSEESDDGYRWHDLGIQTYKGSQQHWILYFSKAANKKELKTLERQIEKAHQQQEKAWWHLSCQLFQCESDALKAAKDQKKTLKYHEVTLDIIEVKKHEKRGRPKAGSEPTISGYKISYTLNRNETLIAEHKAKRGRFILATNKYADKMLPEEILKTYKGQSGVEKSFKFIKNNTFEVDSIFLKNPGRIEALMMVMTLCLLIYGLTEYELHQSLAAADETILNQVKKPTSKPSLKWVYFLFRVVSEIRIEAGELSRSLVVNVDNVLRQLLKHFGPWAQRVYLNTLNTS